MPTKHRIAPPLDEYAQEEAKKAQRRWGRLAARDPHVLVNLARKNTVPALARLVDLMNGKSGAKMTVITKDGEATQVDIPVPPAVMLRAAEIVIERGYGKAPQAILVKADGDMKEGEHAIPIMERIAMLKASMDEKDSTVDLEASEQAEDMENTEDAIEAETTALVLVSGEPTGDIPMNHPSPNVVVGDADKI
jgi:hypothetical protein